MLIDKHVRRLNVTMDEAGRVDEIKTTQEVIEDCYDMLLVEVYFARLAQ